MLLLPQDSTALHTAASGAPTAVVALCTFLLGAGQALQAWSAHKKGKKGATHSTAALCRIEEKLDGFIASQTATNHDHDLRIREVSAHVIGPDGENGLRSRVKQLEEHRSDIPRRVGALDRRSSPI